MILPKVYYLHKTKNENYDAGKELHTIEYSRGWVEYLLETSDIYFQSGLTDRQYQNFLSTALNWIKTYYFSKHYKNMAFLKQLAEIRKESPFSLPLFADGSGHTLTCGATRFTAEALSGTDPGLIPVVFQTEKNSPAPSELAQRITSTDQLHSLANLDQTNFILEFSKSTKPIVISSVLRNSVYEQDPERKTFKEAGEFIFKFWDKFTRDGLIDLTVSCNSTTRDLIKFDPKIWNVTYCDLEHQGFGFGQILGKFADQTTTGLNLYVYNISEPLHLEYLLPWGHSNTVWFHTLNKQIHLFETTRGTATACWPIQAMGNFVK